MPLTRSKARSRICLSRRGKCAEPARLCATLYDDALISLSPSPGVVHRWLRTRPFLFAGTVRWANILRRYRYLLPAGVVVVLATAGLLTVPYVGHSLDAAARFPLTSFTSLVAACAIATAHRKARIRRSLVDSWLAPLSASSSVVLRMVLPPLVQLVLLALGISIPLLAGTLGWPGAVTLWMTVGAGYLVGSLIGWFSQGGLRVAAPAFHYVAVRKPRENWAQAPRLEPLSYWAIGQARAIAKPQVAANAMLLVLVAIPLGTPGQQAIAIAAGAWVLLQVAALFIATVRVAFPATRWLAITNISYLKLSAALGYRVVLAQLWVWSWVVFLTYAAALPGALRIGLPLLLLFLVLTCAVTLVASWVAMKAVGMRSP